MMPEDSQDDLLFAGSMDDATETKKFLDSLKQAMRDSKSNGSDSLSPTSPQPCRTRLERFCKHVITNYHAGDDSVYENIITAALLLDDPSLFFMVVKGKAAHIPLSAYQKIGLALLFEVSTPLKWLEGIALAAQLSGRLHEKWTKL